MTDTQKLLVELLSAAIRREKPGMHIMHMREDTGLRDLLEEARAHQVQALLYPVLRSLDCLKGVDSGVMRTWEKDAVLNGIMQTQHIRQIRKVLYAFSEECIEVIALKGLVLRELYPRPELRAMIDADLLVHREDIEPARNLLLRMGYVEGDITPMHIHFKHPKHFTIELHWTLTDERYIASVPAYEDRVWEASVPLEIHGAPCRTLSPEDQAVHICLHMATHMVSSGFGLRQLCDLVLFVEANGDKTDWHSFCEKLEMYGMSRFVPAVFMLCGRLFDMRIPDAICCRALNDGKYLDMLTKDIFSGGVYGKRNLACMYGSELGREFGRGPGRSRHGKAAGDRLARVKGFLSIFFPPVKSLSDRYRYAEKCCLLILAAWAHHVICGVFNRNYSFAEKLKFFFFSLSISNKRSKLLQWLGLCSHIPYKQFIFRSKMHKY